MDKQKRHNSNNFENYLNYFRNLFSGREKHIFEKTVLQDKFAQDAFDGFSRLNADEVSHDVSELRKKIEERTSSRKLITLPFLRYTAAAILLLGIGTTIYLVRQSTNKPVQLAEQIVEEDTSLRREAILQAEQDTLRKNIAYHPVSEKKPEQKDEKISEIELPVQETDLSESIASSEIEAGSTTSDEVSIDSDIRFEVEAETEDIINDFALNTDEVRKDRSKAGTHDDSSAKRKTQSQPEKTPVVSKIDGSYDKTVITGRVIASSDETPLPGVNILVKGTSTGTVSDIDGNFQLQVPADDSSVLQFAYVGYTTEELEVRDYNDVTVALNEDLLALDEVVVVGYGTTKNAELTGAVSTIQIDEGPASAPVIVPPKPVNGLSAYKKYVREKTDYKTLPYFEKPVFVKVSFSVMQDGTITDIEIIKSVGEAFDKEVIRLIKEGPAWTPGTENGIPVNREVTLKIKFQPKILSSQENLDEN